MIYNLIRLVIGAAAFCATRAAIRRSGGLHRCRKMVAALFGAVLLATGLELIPIENAFVTFSSPEAAYGYRNSEPLAFAVSGETADLAIGEKKTTMILPKTDKGWKLPFVFWEKTIYRMYDDGIVVILDQYECAGAFFVTVYRDDGKECTVSDDRDSVFQCRKEPGFSENQPFCTYYAYINAMDSQYRLTVDGTELCPAAPRTEAEG